MTYDRCDGSFVMKWCLGIIAVLVALCIAEWIGSSYFESQTYNRLTGAHTTTWDAMWVELRVMDAPAK